MRKIAFSLVTILLFLLCIEGIFRLSGITRKLAAESERISPIIQRDDELMWKLFPNLSVRYLDAEIHTTPDRFRVVVPERREAPHLVLCAGDSVTFGWRFDDAETYPSRLQRLLDRDNPGEFRVINAGVPGYSSEQGRRYLHRLLSVFHPDIVVIGFSINDRFPSFISDSALLSGGSRRWTSRLRHLGIYLFLERSIAARRRVRFNEMAISTPREEVRPGEHHRVAPEEFRSNLEVMLSECLASGARPILILEHVTSLDTRDDYQEIVRDLADIHGLAFIDCPSLFMESSEGPSGETVIRRREKQSEILQKQKQWHRPAQKISRRQSLQLLQMRTFSRDEGWMLDPVHPNINGYKKMASALAEAILNDRRTGD